MALRVQLGCYASHACGVSPDVWLRDAFRRMYWANPLTYALKALVVNEFDSPRWDKPLPSFEAAQVLLHAASTSDCSTVLSQPCNCWRPASEPLPTPFNLHT